MNYEFGIPNTRRHLCIHQRPRCCLCGNRDLHGDGDDGNPAESAGNPREWVQLLREYRGDGTKTCGNPAGMEFIAVENPRVCFGKCAISIYRDCYTPTDGDQGRTNRRLLAYLSSHHFCVGSFVKL